jgi:cobalt-zinc-cadmium efflux system outer membrane protein
MASSRHAVSMLLPVVAVAAATAASAQPLPLSDAIAMARQASALTAAARVRTAAAGTTADMINRLPNPSIEFRTENWHSGTSVLPSDTFLVVTQPVELGGKLSARRAQQRSALESSDAAAALIERDVTWDVVRRYIDVLRQRSTLLSLIDQEAGLAEMVRVLTVRSDEGLVAEADLRRFQSERGRVQTHIVRTEGQLRLALGRLNALLGGRAFTADALSMPVLPQTILVRASLGSVTDVERRPEIIAARARLAHAQAELAMEQARRVPDLLISGGYKRTAGLNTGVFAVAIPLPIFDSNRVARTTAAAEVRAAEMELTFIRDQARLAADSQMLIARRLAEHAAEIQRTQTEPAAVVRVAARAAFVEGAGDLLRLVDAERVHAEAVREAADLRLDALIAFFEARLLAGEDPLP